MTDKSQVSQSELKCPFCGEPLQAEQEAYYAWVWTCKKCKVVLLRMKVEWG